MDVDAVLLGEGGVAVLALEGFLASVDAHVDVEAVVGGEALVAHRAVVRGFTQVLLHVCLPPRLAVEHLGAELALIPLWGHMHATSVNLQRVRCPKPLPTHVAHVIVGRLGDVRALVVTQGGAVPEGVVAGGTLVLLRPLSDLPMNFDEVHVEAGLVGEDAAAVVTQVPQLGGVEQAALHVRQFLALRADVNAGQLALAIHADVFGGFVLGDGGLSTAQTLLCRSVALSLEQSHPIPGICKQLYLCTGMNMYTCVSCVAYACGFISRVVDQNGVSGLYHILEIHHSGREPSIWTFMYICMCT